jgi:two-component sensor histidine kinase
MDLIADIVAQARAPYRHDGERRLHLAGRRAPVAGMGLAVQKLVAGAGRYGAFLNGKGEIRIRGTVEGSAGPPGLHIHWEGSGGPLVQSPTRRGFGTRLTERRLAQELGGSVSVAFAPKGLTCAVDASLQGYS